MSPCFTIEYSSCDCFKCFQIGHISDKLQGFVICEAETRTCRTEKGLCLFRTTGILHTVGLYCATCTALNKSSMKNSPEEIFSHFGSTETMLWSFCCSERRPLSNFNHEWFFMREAVEMVDLLQTTNNWEENWWQGSKTECCWEKECMIRQVPGDTGEVWVQMHKKRKT